MRVYSDTMAEMALYAEAPKGCIADVYAMPAPKKRKKGWTVKLWRRGSRRHANTGTRGAGEIGVASYNDYGWWIAALYRHDPEMAFGPYESETDFHEKTLGKYRVVQVAEIRDPS